MVVGEPRHCCGWCCLYVPRASCWKRSTRSRFCARSSVNQPMAPRPALCRRRRSLRSPRLGAPQRMKISRRSVGRTRARVSAPPRHSRSDSRSRKALRAAPLNRRDGECQAREGGSAARGASCAFQGDRRGKMHGSSPERRYAPRLRPCQISPLLHPHAAAAADASRAGATDPSSLPSVPRFRRALLLQ